MSRSDDLLLKKVTWRLLPLLCLGFVVCILDRLNLSFAAVRMNADIGLSAAAYGFGAGAYFIAYLAFEVPSNIALARIGARRWISRIMLTWGVVSMGMALVDGPKSFVAMRVLLGAAEAGFFPGVVYYLNQWFPASHVRRPMAILFAFGPLASALGAPISNVLIQSWGWRWMFVIEGFPAIVIGIAILMWLPDRPAEAAWLSADEKRALEKLAPGAQAKPLNSSSLAFLFERTSLLLGFQFFLIMTASYAIQLWLPLIINELGLRADQATWAVAVPYGLSAASLVAFGLFASSSGSARGHVITFMVVAAAGFLGGALSTHLSITLVCLCLVLCGTYLGVTAYWTIPRAVATGTAAAASIAFSNAAGNFGGFVGPYAMGLARERFGDFESGLVFASALSVLAALMTFATTSGRRADARRIH